MPVAPEPDVPCVFPSSVLSFPAFITLLFPQSSCSSSIFSETSCAAPPARSSSSESHPDMCRIRRRRALRIRGFSSRALSASPEGAGDSPGTPIPAVLNSGGRPAASPAAIRNNSPERRLLTSGRFFRIRIPIPAATVRGSGFRPAAGMMTEAGNHPFSPEVPESPQGAVPENNRKTGRRNT